MASSKENNETKTKSTEKTTKPSSSGKIVRFFADQRTKYGIGILLLVLTAYLALAFTSFFFTAAVDNAKIAEISSKKQEITALKKNALPSEEAIDKLKLDIKKSKKEITNWAGPMGAYISRFFVNDCFGIASYFILYLLFIVGMRFMRVRLVTLWKAIVVTLLALVWIPTATAFAFFGFYNDTAVNFGGVVGMAMSDWITLNIGVFGTFLILFSTFVIFWIFAHSGTIPLLKRITLFLWEKFKLLFAKKEKPAKEEKPVEQPANVPDIEIIEPELVQEAKEEDDDGVWVIAENPEETEFEIIVPQDEEYTPEPIIDEIPEPISPVLRNNNNGDDDEKYDALAELGEYDPTLDLSRYHFPTFELLKDYGSGQGAVNAEEQNANKNRITTTLRNYGIEIDMIKATVGPTITLYEIVPKAGVRISKIKNLENDIMLSLAATGIRIIAPIPGKGTIGIEVPNADPQTVSMLSIIGSKKFQESKFALPVAFGRTITNEIFMVDLCKMPHLLVAGATGQGKSVGLNAIITSLLYKKHPAYLKFVLVDPKKVEFNIYSKIEKHFLAKLPDGEDAIITDVTKVVQTLNSLTKEMDMRYDLLKKAHVRNISEYNEKFVQRHLNPEKGHRFLPYIVVIVDEFGDLIMVAGKEVELPIARIAQLARAVGIHMIIATQRPSVNIITGVIKANFPARVAFRVSSQIDSRTILDASGANQLVGRGDMLFSQGSDLVRVQCAFVDTPEVERISDYIGDQQGYPTAFYLPEPEMAEGSDLSDVDLGKKDPMFDEAARLIVAHQSGSTSLIQRKFSIGYNRAGRIMDQLEAAGIVGPFEGSKARQVLIPDEYSLEQKLQTL